MTSDYREEKQAGLRQALAAWAILLVLITALQVLDLLRHDHPLAESTRTTNFQP
jgi:hypothetical protein